MWKSVSLHGQISTTIGEELVINKVNEAIEYRKENCKLLTTTKREVKREVIAGIGELDSHAKAFFLGCN
jgi:hypothetical protein